MKRNYVALYLILLGIAFSMLGYYQGLRGKFFSIVNFILIAVAFGGYLFTYNYIKSLELMQDVS